MRAIPTILAFLQLGIPVAFGWGAQVHRMVTRAALDGLPADAPTWLRDARGQERAAFESNQPDRWRGFDALILRHENNQDHFLDAESLEQFGLSLDAIPEFRMEYIRQMAVAKVEHPERIAPYDAAKDAAREHEWPGFVLHAAAEHYVKLQAAFLQVRIIEKLNDPARQAQLDESRAIAIYHLGALSHFVADIAQPLHTTKHYNGWVGENPKGYKWRDKFHAYIDEGWAKRLAISPEVLRANAKFDVQVNATDPWTDVLTHFKRSHALVEPLYALERDGTLDAAEGKAMLSARLADATGMLSALIRAAWETSAPTDKQVESWLHYDDAGQTTPNVVPSNSAPAPRTP